MKILLINHYAGSPRHGMEYRPYYFAREFVRLGHQVRIVAASESHVRAVQPRLGNGDVLGETIDGIRYSWFATPAYSGNGIGRVRNMLSFVWRLFRKGRRIADSDRPDLVIASSTYPMDIWPARRIARRAGAKLVFEVHDLWPLSPMELGGMSRWHPFIMLVQAVEDYAYRHADVVISILPKVREYMESRGLLPSKLCIVPNGVDPAEWPVPPVPLAGPVADLIARLRANGTKVIGYAGSHGLANALHVLLDAASLMKGEPVVFVLVGGGPEKVALKRHAERLGLDNVRFIDPVPKEQIPALLVQFDVAYIGLQRQPLFRFGIAPNKLMDYMMAARPVLMAIEAGNDPVAEAGCGLTVRPEDPAAIADGLRTLLALSDEDRETMGRRGRAFVLANHTYPILARKFLAACEARGA